ncbi:MAG: beta-galactosidase [Candidatus Sumerlaeia bacterium]|nr:beta-galactosidase [Candidatus Sumerlaeia bacterium]
MRKILGLVGCWAMMAAAGFAAGASSSKWAFVKVAPDGRGFVAGESPWHPFGCNYFDPHVGWAPKMWREFDAGRVEEHFRIMQHLGVNVVRVFLAAQSFYPTPPRLEPEALEKFDRLLDIARRYGIRVHPTGLDAWEGNPPWRRGDIFADEAVRAHQVGFWKAFAARYKDEPAIFAYDLLNEPHVHWSGRAMESAWRKWLVQHYGTIEALRKAWKNEATPFEAFDAIPVPRDEPASASRMLADYQRFRESVGERWVKEQADAIRSADPNHLITVGFIQWTVPVLHGRPSRYAGFHPAQIAAHVDFLSVHFYPLWGDPLRSDEEFDRNLAYLEFLLRYVHAGDPTKPLVVGEFGWYGGGRTSDRAQVRSEADQARWCEAAVLQGRGVAAGWLNWAYADTPSATDITKFSGLVTETGKTKAWGEAFARLAREPARWLDRANPPARRFRFDVERALVNPRAGDKALTQYLELWKADKRCDLEVSQ